MYVCMYVYIYIYIYASLSLYIYIYICLCMYVCMYACMYVYIYIYTHVYIYIYIYIYHCSGPICTRSKSKDSKPGASNLFALCERRVRRRDNRGRAQACTLGLVMYQSAHLKRDCAIHSPLERRGGREPWEA